MDLRFDLSIDIADQGTQRCRISPEEMDARNIHINECVKVKTQRNTYLCAAWPRSDGFQNVVQYDTVSYLEKEEPDEVQSQNTVEKVKSKKIKHFSVEVVFKKVQDVRKYRQCIKDSSDPSRHKSLKKMVVEVLHRLYIGPGVCFDCASLRIAKLYNISYIKIHDSGTNDPQIKYGMISSDVKIEIIDVLSTEKYELRQDGRRKILCGGFDLQEHLLTEFCQFPLCHAKAAKQLGVDWSHGLLLQGPSGTGKTTLVYKVAQDLDLIVLKTDGSSVYGSRAGEGEEKIRTLFKKAEDLSDEAPCIVLIEDVDSMCPRQGARSQSVQEKRMVTQLAACMDRLTPDVKVLVVGTTSHPHMVDPVLRRPGRFEKEILLGVPSMAQRRKILELLVDGKPCAPCVNIAQLSESTPGFVAADLTALVNKAHYIAATSENCADSIKMGHFNKALHEVVPSTQRGSDILVDHRPVSWDNVGGLDDVKDKLKQAVEWPLKHGAAFTRLGIRPPSGVLLYGPPGCAKTLLVRAAATASGATFLAISGAQLHSPFVGDAEKKLTEVFRQARAGAPSILFLDEVDAILGKRKEGGKSAGAHERVLSMLLNELDGIGVRTQNLVRNREIRMEAEGEGNSVQSTDEAPGTVSVDNSGVLVVAATNRPDMVDDALMRPGRLDKVIYVPPPDLKARLEILKVHTRETPTENVKLEKIAERTDGYSGADLENLCREAALHALSVDGLETEAISQRHLEAMLDILKPSLTGQELNQYRRYLKTSSQENVGFGFSNAASLDKQTNFDFSSPTGKS